MPQPKDRLLSKLQASWMRAPARQRSQSCSGHTVTVAGDYE